jgi:hypothetical protein
LSVFGFFFSRLLRCSLFAMSCLLPHLVTAIRARRFAV